MIPFNVADSSVADDRNVVNRAIGQPAGARPESLVIGRFEVGTDMPKSAQKVVLDVGIAELAIPRLMEVRSGLEG